MKGKKLLKIINVILAKQRNIMHSADACPGIRRGGGGQNLKVFKIFFCFSIFQKFSTKKVAKYR